MQLENPEGGTGLMLRPDVHRGAVALVIGGGTGIGRAVALDLARCGSDVVAGRCPESLEKMAQIEAMGSRALALLVDIREDDQVRSLVDRALERFGRIDIFVNNARGQFFAPAEAITGKGWRAVHHLSVDATWAVTRGVSLDPRPHRPVRPEKRCGVWRQQRRDQVWQLAERASPSG
jgi:citronellol/citronellal dehydrogenase